MPTKDRDKGIAALRAGDKAKARAFLSPYVERYPADVQAWHALAETFDDEASRQLCMKRAEAALRNVPESAAAPAAPQERWLRLRDSLRGWGSGALVSALMVVCLVVGAFYLVSKDIGADDTASGYELCKSAVVKRMADTTVVMPPFEEIAVLPLGGNRRGHAQYELRGVAQIEQHTSNFDLEFRCVVSFSGMQRTPRLEISEIR